MQHITTTKCEIKHFPYLPDCPTLTTVPGVGFGLVSCTGLVRPGLTMGSGRPLSSRAYSLIASRIVFVFSSPNILTLFSIITISDSKAFICFCISASVIRMSSPFFFDCVYVENIIIFLSSDFSMSLKFWLIELLRSLHVDLFVPSSCIAYLGFRSDSSMKRDEAKNIKLKSEFLKQWHLQNRM